MSRPLFSDQPLQVVHKSLAIERVRHAQRQGRYEAKREMRRQAAGLIQAAKRVLAMTALDPKDCVFCPGESVRHTSELCPVRALVAALVDFGAWPQARTR